jgi:outer membrane protein OmpA-like peptidoglycan-associated protein
MTQFRNLTLTALACAGICCVSGLGMAQTQTAPAADQTAAPAATPAQTTPTATGKQPLEMQSHEGFWGHVNPMARKKWVDRQTEPIKGRLNELDQLTAKNASDIRELDERATAGIKQASDTANAANQTATDASTRATAAQTQAQSAVMQADKLNGTVSTLDQYKPVTDAELHFRAGSTTLGAKSKAALDEIADQLNGQKGYIVQVQGFTRTRGEAGVAASQQMADSVVRYLVEKKNVPLYRIYKMGYGSARPSDVTVSGGSVVQVTLMHNSLADLNGAPAATGPNTDSSIGATQPSK